MATAAEIKTQKELEQPVKGYQLQRVEDKLDSFEKNITRSLDSLTQTVVTNPTVSPATLESTVQAIRKEFKAYVDSEIKGVHSEYAPVKTFNKWLFRAIVAQLVIIVAQIIYLQYLRGK